MKFAKYQVSVSFCFIFKSAKEMIIIANSSVDLYVTFFLKSNAQMAPISIRKLFSQLHAKLSPFEITRHDEIMQSQRTK